MVAHIARKPIEGVFAFDVIDRSNKDLVGLGFSGVLGSDFLGKATTGNSKGLGSGIKWVLIELPTVGHRPSELGIVAGDRPARRSVHPIGIGPCHTLKTDKAQSSGMA